MYNFSIGLCFIGYYGLTFILHPKRTLREAREKELGEYDVALHINLGLWCFFTMLAIVFIIFNAILGELNFFEEFLMAYSFYFYTPYTVISVIVMCVILSKAKKQMEEDAKKNRAAWEREREERMAKKKESDRDWREFERLYRKMK